MIKRIAFISIPVENQARAVRFYTENLGFEVVRDEAINEKERWIELRIPGAETKISLFTPESHRGRVGEFLNAGFTCDDVRETYEEFRARGVTVLGGPKTEPWGSFFLMQDSEGNTICVSGAT